MSTPNLLLIIFSLIATATATAIATSSSRHVVGGYEPIEDLMDPNLVTIAKFAVDEYNKETSSHLELIKIIKGEQQVVAGMNYKLVISVKDGSLSGRSHKYQAIVYDVAWKHTRNLTSFLPL